MRDGKIFIVILLSGFYAASRGDKENFSSSGDGAAATMTIRSIDNIPPVPSNMRITTERNIEFVCKMPKIFLGLEDREEKGSEKFYHFMIFYDLSYYFWCHDWGCSPSFPILWPQLHRRLLKILKNFPSRKLLRLSIWIFFDYHFSSGISMNKYHQDVVSDVCELNCK